LELGQEPIITDAPAITSGTFEVTKQDIKIKQGSSFLFNDYSVSKSPESFTARHRSSPRIAATILSVTNG